MFLKVSIFDNLNTVLHQLGEFFAQILHSLRVLPQLFVDGAEVTNRYLDMFPDFISFLIVFAFGTGIIRKLLHWGS